MLRKFVSLSVAFAIALAPASSHAGLGRDLTNMNSCLYEDCEAGGGGPADQWYWSNPANPAASILPLMTHGAVMSTGYFNFTVGDVHADVESLTLTYAYDPFVLQVNMAHADANGEASSTPGLDFDLNSDVVRLGASIDLGRIGLFHGLSVGVLAALPVTDSDLDLSSGGVNVVDSIEDRDLDLTVGVHYRTGQRDWFSVGALVQVIENDVRTTVLDPESGMAFRTKGTTNAWFVEAGVSLLPFVPLGLAHPRTAVGQLASEFRLGFDVKHRNISAPGEGTSAKEVANLRIDALLLPDELNRFSWLFRPYGIAGVDTDGGYGVGVGIYGNPDGPFGWLSINVGYSRRDLAPSIGDEVEQVGISLSIVAPL